VAIKAIELDCPHHLAQRTRAHRTNCPDSRRRRVMSRIYLLQAFYALEPHENDKRLLWEIFIYQTCPHIFITALVTVGLLTVTVLVGFCREQGGFSLKAESRRPREFAKESSLRGYSTVTMWLGLIGSDCICPDWTSLSASGLMKRMRPSCGSDVKLRTALHPLHHGA